MIVDMDLQHTIGMFDFHHIGVATRSIEREIPIYSLMGYKKESDVFDDPAQGIRGLLSQRRISRAWSCWKTWREVKP